MKSLSHFARQGSHNDKERAEAKCLLMQLLSLPVVFIIHLLDLALPVVNCASQYLQGKSADIATACKLIDSKVESLNSMRNDQAF